MKKKVQSNNFKTKHMKKNIRASPARKDHHLTHVRFQFTREYIKIKVQICPCLLYIVVQLEIKEIFRYQKGSIFRIKGPPFDARAIPVHQRIHQNQRANLPVSFIYCCTA